MGRHCDTSDVRVVARVDQVVVIKSFADRLDAKVSGFAVDGFPHPGRTGRSRRVNDNRISAFEVPRHAGKRHVVDYRVTESQDGVGGATAETAQRVVRVRQIAQVFFLRKVVEVEL